jgi:hypothetical protein
VTTLARARARRDLGPGALGLSYLAGVAAFGVVAQALLVLGAALTRGEIVLVCGLLALGVLAPNGRGQVLRCDTPRRRCGNARPDPEGPARRFWPAPAAAFLALLALDLWYQPLWWFDAWTFWTPKAQALVALGGLDAAWFTQADLPNPDYPLLLPAVEAGGFRFTGYETALLDVQSWIFLVAFVAAVAGVAVRRAPRPAVWVPLTMVVFAPAVAELLAAAEADIPVATLFAAAGLCAFLWLTERRPGALALAAVLAAGAVATKVEGLLFALALFAALAAVTWSRSRRDAAVAAGAGAAAVVAGALPWRLWLSTHDVPSQSSLGRVTDASFLASHVSRVPPAAADVAWRALDPTRWLLVVPLAALAVALAWRAGRRREAAFAAGVVVLSLVGLVLAYWTTPLEFHYHLATSARRVVTGPVLLAAALTPLLLEGAGGNAKRRGGYPLGS